MPKILNVVGARPQFIKLAPLLQAVASHNEQYDRKVSSITLHTGQHYDHGMSDIFFEELEIPKADVNLGVGSGSHGKQTGKMLEGTEQVLLEQQPDAVIIFGDTNSTVAAALAAVKLHIPVVHVEAGLRSFNRRMPEEINRVVADHISNLLLAPTKTAITNLEKEGLADKSVLSGDIMYDTVIRNQKLAAQKSNLLTHHQLASKSYYVATVHRAENTDELQRLSNILQMFNKVAKEHGTLVFPMHPRTTNTIKKHLPDWTPHPRLKVIAPVGYLDMLELVSNAKLAFTDSGGLQKEAFFLNCPCITLRDETEWVETVQANANFIVGADTQEIEKAFGYWENKLGKGEVDFSDKIQQYFGDGKSAALTLDETLKLIS